MRPKRPHLLFLLFTALVLVLAGCGPAVATEPPATPAPAQPTGSPTLIPAPTQVPPTETLVPINLAGPEMRLGSTWSYVDGGIIVAIPGGEFIMGRGGSDNPQHTVSLGDFWIYRMEVTNQQYQACVGAGECSPPNAEDNKIYTDRTRLNDPVTGVSWSQAQSYCAFVHGRLPTEAEWEKAARGPDGNIYPWGDAAPTCGLLNFNNCLGKTNNVTLYPQGQSYYEVFDMAGNTFEWVADWYDPIYYKTSPVENPVGPEAGTRRSIRSTSFKSNPSQAVTSARFFDDPRTHSRDRSFRCVVEEPTYFAPFCHQVPVYGRSPDGGSTDGALPECDKQVDVDSQAQSCKLGTAYVTFKSNDPSAVISGVEACGAPISGAPGSFPQVYQCAANGLATIDAACSFSALEPTAECAEHYTLDPVAGVCVWDGTGSLSDRCPTGYDFDSAKQCCTAQPGSGENYPVCAVGSALVEDPPDKYKCVWNGLVPPPAHDEVAIILPVACNIGGTPQASCSDPKAHTSSSSCIAAGCVWLPSRTAPNGGTCTFPP